MLLIASETVRGSRALNDVVREMSLSLRFFSGADKLADLGEGPWRRIILLTEADVVEATYDALIGAPDQASTAIIITADEPTIASSDRAGIIDKLAEIADLEWIGTEFDFDTLAAAARRARRHMLRVSCEDLERAFDENEFVVQYQPKVERSTARRWVTREAEALIRWQHPDHGLIGPLEFLPEIEEFGLMPTLTEYVLVKTARQLAEWDKDGLELNGCINLASSLLIDTSIGDRYAGIVRSAGIDSERFTFEVVEQDLAHPEAPHIQALLGLRAQGFRLSLDDFRVAATSLATFEKLPFDEIKLHASAIRSARNDTVALHVLAAVAGLAHNLGMAVCAEGVEDQQTFDFLQMIECDKMQGFLVSEAVLPEIIQRSYSAREANVEVA